jgi:hypothetical protein
MLMVNSALGSSAASFLSAYKVIIPGAPGGMTTALKQMTEDELLERARKALLRAVQLPRGSLERSVQWGVYDMYADELRRRAVRFLARKNS